MKAHKVRKNINMHKARKKMRGRKAHKNDGT